MIKPMLASLVDAPLTDAALVYEPKYDGIRAIADVAPGGPVRLWSRLGNEKTRQFPEIAGALARWSRRLRAPVVLDGEIVALNAAGEPTGFQQLQGRIHLTGATAPPPGRTAFIAFDLLRDGQTDWRSRMLVERRKALEARFGKTGSPMLRISEIAHGDGRALYERALASGWEGLIAKCADSRYQSGKRSPDWRKLKIVLEQEFVIGGWTEPRQTRQYFGALLLGVYDARSGGAGERALVYVGHVGTGFNERELARVMRLLRRLETAACPFRVKPPSNEKPHWVKPELVCQVKFTEWTADGLLRHPVYLGLRDDKKARDVVRENTARFHAATSVRLKPDATPAARVRRRPEATPASRVRRKPDAAPDYSGIVAQLQDIESGRGDGVVEIADGVRVSVTNLRKVFWPKQKLTKGDLMRYYAQAAPFLLPAIADRPLVMKRFPNGIDAKPFYQHRAGDAVPPGVRAETITLGAERRMHFVGGDLATLLYTTQLAAISQDPFFSRIGSLEYADFVALDLDPSEGVPFTQVLDVARWIHEELESLGAVGVPKTSGADGLHVYLPLPPQTPYEAGLLLCQLIATVVSHKHPKQATIERAVRARGKRVYVDYLQNIQGKTLASAYSARASQYAGVSTPLAWSEVHAGITREDFTIVTAPARFAAVGDLWAPIREARGIDLARLERYAARAT
jgi:bifunctional non-homologous end joining protein LigD